MPTIIPFPKLYAIDGDICVEPGRPRLIEPRVSDAVVAYRGDQDLPEGESTNAAIDESVKARAMHEEIVGLIRAVRSRFG
jgi:hypothetical protein